MEETRRRRWLRFGPGTLLAITTVAVILVSGRLTAPNRGIGQGRIAFEADADGKMRRVEPPSALPAESGALWKPEPRILLEHYVDLLLTPGQKSRIARIDQKWRSEKRSWEQAIQDAAASADEALGGERASVPRIQQGLSAYSALSRQYDEARARYWAQAVSLLRADQKEKVAQLAPKAKDR